MIFCVSDCPRLLYVEACIRILAVLCRVVYYLNDVDVGGRA